MPPKIIGRTPLLWHRGCLGGRQQKRVRARQGFTGGIQAQATRDAPVRLIAGGLVLETGAGEYSLANELIVMELTRNPRLKWLLGAASALLLSLATRAETDPKFYAVM